MARNLDNMNEISNRKTIVPLTSIAQRELLLTCEPMFSVFFTEMGSYFM